MARVLNVEIPNNKVILYSLTYIHGIGNSLAKKILIEAKVADNKRTKELTNDELLRINEAGKPYTIEGNKRRQVALNIKRLMEIRSYRGSRHRKSLPVRGQITQKNARTRKGPRKTVAGKKK